MNSISQLKEQKYHTNVLLGLVIFIAAFLRLYYLSDLSFSGDDIVSLSTIKKVRFGDMIEDAAGRRHPPFYFILLHYWMQMAGSGDFVLKLPSAIFGILSVFVLFKVARLIFDDKTALIGAILLAVNPEHFFYSGTLKQYTLTVLLGLLSIYLLLRALKSASGGRALLWTAFRICTAALIFTHYSALLVVLTEMFYLAIIYKKQKCARQVFSSFGFLFFSFLVLFLIQEMYVKLPIQFRWIATPIAEAFLNVLSLFFAGFYIIVPKVGIIFADGIYFKGQGPYIDSLPLPAKISIFVYFSILLLFGIFKWLSNRERKIAISSNDNYNPLIYIWATVPIIFAYASSFIFWPRFDCTRYHLFWSCLVILLIAKGIASVGKLRFICAILFFAVGFNLFPIVTSESNSRRLDWKSVANYLRENVSEGETVHILSTDFASAPLKYHYKERVYTGTDNVFKTPSSDVYGRLKGVFLIEAGENYIPIGLTRNLDMFYTNRVEKQFHHIKVTHYWKPKNMLLNFK